MTIKRHAGLASRLMLCICLAAGVLSGRLSPTEAASATGSSTWYWQNPLPHPYAVNAVACASVSHCVAVGTGGTTLRTIDGGQHWTAGSVVGLTPYAVSCPTQVVCYALGNTGHGHLLKSVNGGATWQDILLSGFRVPQTITCPSAATCLLIESASDGSQLLRTTDGGHTWVDVLASPASVSCISRRVCFAGTEPTSASAGTAETPMVYRSADAGRTWTRFPQIQEDALSCTSDGSCVVAGLPALACSPAGFCLAVFNRTTYLSTCGCAYEPDGADLFVSKNGGATWTQVDHVSQGAFGFAACTGTSTCYALAQPYYALAAEQAQVLRTTDGGKTWATVSLPIFMTGSFNSRSAMACPGARTCYVAAGFTLVRTMDGFHHVAETPASNAIGPRSLDAVQCPTRIMCYAGGANPINRGGGAASLVATTNGGHTWTARPDLRPGMRLACPSSTVCYGVGGGGGPTRPVTLFRTNDGARHWQLLSGTATTGTQFGISCPAVETCYVGVGTHVGGTWHLSVLVTRDGGTRWTLKPAFNSAANILLTIGSLSCPSVTICFAVVFAPASTVSSSPPVLMETRDGGQRWITVASLAHDLGTLQGTPNPLSCPSVTTCYILSLPNQSPATIVTTHDGGSSWHRTGFGPHLLIKGIACATAATCRVITQAGVWATANGGKTWQQQASPMGGLGITGIACPGVDTCYAVGGMNILATHRP